jgi:hypothetical protein
MPWIMGGYFNLITSLYEKKGGINLLDQDSYHFKETIGVLRMVDWETSNGTFTWNNHLKRCPSNCLTLITS